MRLLILSAVLIGPNLAVAVAQDTPFPYDAVVQSEEDVRSGPGEKKYYATGKVHKGDHVRVHRHDLGGWFLISPPADSFCWIRADFVERTAEQSGLVKSHKEKVPVYVGSILREEHRDVCQRRLSDGDEVRILGAKSFPGPHGTEHWYKIAPPANEFRWINGRCLAPVKHGNESAKRSSQNHPAQEQATIAEFDEHHSASRRAQQEAGSDPYRGEAAAERDDEFSDPNRGQSRGRRAPRRPAVEYPQDGSHVARSGPTPEELAQDRMQLRALDARLKEIVNEDTGTWDFTEIEQAYVDFQQEIPYQTLRRQIDLRLAWITEYREVQKEYVDFMRLAQRTSRRESNLLAEHRGHDLRLNVQKPVESTPEMQPQAAEVPIQQVAVPQRGRPEWTFPQERVQQQQQNPRFDGAGIVQHTTSKYPGGPLYKLVAPDGRFLAYLYADRGTNLEELVGQSLGINGQRRFDPNYRADFIAVQNWAPVSFGTIAASTVELPRGALTLEFNIPAAFCWPEMEKQAEA